MNAPIVGPDGKVQPTHVFVQRFAIFEGLATQIERKVNDFLDEDGQLRNGLRLEPHGRDGVNASATWLLTYTEARQLR